MPSKYYNITNQDTGEKTKVLWDKNEPPTEEEIDQIFATEKDRKMPVTDPSYKNFKLDKVKNPTMQVSDPTANNSNTSVKDDQDKTNDEEPANYADYHKSISDISEDPDNYQHLLNCIKSGKANGVKGDQMESLLLAHGVHPEKAKFAKDLA